MGSRGNRIDLFPDSTKHSDTIDYCDLCDLCIRNSMIPSRGIGVVGGGTILHLVTSPSSADTKSKIILSGNVGKFVRSILYDRGLLNKSYITSVVKCGLFKDINPKSITCCFNRLKTEIETVNPKIFVTYGKDPYFIIMGSKMPKVQEGFNILADGRFHVYMPSLEYMNFNKDFSYLDRGYSVVVDIYRKFVNPYVLMK